MSIHDQIKSAIGAHGLWKSRLREAIAGGTSQLRASVVRDDHQCEFGKWLHSADATTKQSKHYGSCLEIHRRFHIAAAKIVSLIAVGKKQEASEALEGNSDFSKTSTELTLAMMAWRAAQN